MISECAACCFFRLVETKRKYKQKLCMLTGEKQPQKGEGGCNFIAGAWSQLDDILGLTDGNEADNTGDPNTTKQVAAFSRKGMNVANIHSLDDSIGFPINHTAKAERQFVRLEYREVPVARSARERTDCLFSHLNPTTTRQAWPL